jgi:Protein of unknown function (DUF962)
MNEPPQGFFQRRPLRRALCNWLERHQHPFNRAIHFVGIPLAVAGVVLSVWWWDEWYWGVLAFVVGYLLQWIGHLVEGNDLGEWAAVKRLLGLPYVSVSPRWQRTPTEENPLAGRASDG